MEKFRFSRVDSDERAKKKRTLWGNEIWKAARDHQEMFSSRIANEKQIWEAGKMLSR